MYLFFRDEFNWDKEQARYAEKLFYLLESKSKFRKSKELEDDIPLETFKDFISYFENNNLTIYSIEDYTKTCISLLVDSVREDIKNYILTGATECQLDLIKSIDSTKEGFIVQITDPSNAFYKCYQCSLKNLNIDALMAINNNEYETLLNKCTDIIVDIASYFGDIYKDSSNCNSA